MPAVRAARVRRARRDGQRRQREAEPDDGGEHVAGVREQGQRVSEPAADRFGDEDDGTRIFVIDAKTFKQIGTIAIPGTKPEYIQIDPKTHEIYQNIDSESEIAVIDGQRMQLTRVIPTPEIKHNHPLQYEAKHHMLIAAGENGTLAVYDTTGKLIHKVTYPGRVDQCDFDASRGWLACSGGGVTLYSFDGTNAPKLEAQLSVSPGMHTTAIDSKTGMIWGVYADRATGQAFVQPFTYAP